MGGGCGAGQPKPGAQAPDAETSLPSARGPMTLQEYGPKVPDLPVVKRGQKRNPEQYLTFPSFLKCGQWAHINSFPFSARHSLY